MRFFTGMLLILGCLISCDKNKSFVKIENSSGKTLSKVIVKICNKSFEFEEIESGKTFGFNYLPKGDCSFQMKFQLVDGSTYEKTDGYITTGMRYEHKISFSKDKSITLSLTSIN